MTVPFDPGRRHNSGHRRPVTCWILTRDKKLWIAPKRPGLGLSWGYRGSGQYTLAKLLEVLLDEIISPGVDSFARRRAQDSYGLL